MQLQTEVANPPQQLTQGKDAIFAAHASMYRERGLPVFPFLARAGQPLWPMEWMPETGDVSDALFGAWCAEFPNENISLALGPRSGVCVIDILTNNPKQIATIREIVPVSIWQRTGGHGVAGGYRWSEDFLPFIIRDPETGSIIVRGFGCEGQYTALPPSVRDDAPSYEANCFLGDVVGQLPGAPPLCYERLCEALGCPLETDRGFAPGLQFRHSPPVVKQARSIVFKVFDGLALMMENAPAADG